MKIWNLGGSLVNQKKIKRTCFTGERNQLPDALQKKQHQDHSRGPQRKQHQQLNQPKHQPLGDQNRRLHPYPQHQYHRQSQAQIRGSRVYRRPSLHNSAGNHQSNNSFQNRRDDNAFFGRQRKSNNNNSSGFDVSFCIFCRKRGHTEIQCQKKLICDYCSRSGHVVQDCRSKKQEERQERLYRNILAEQNQQNQLFMQSLQRSLPGNQMTGENHWTGHTNQPYHPSSTNPPQVGHQYVHANRGYTQQHSGTYT